MGTIQINSARYEIPQELDLVGSLDEYSGTYRISLGLVDPTEDQKAKYNPLFAALDAQRRGLFIDTPLTFDQDNQRLRMKLATLDVYNKPYGTFYELESAINDTQITIIKKESMNGSIVKGKTTNRQRKATGKRDNRISRA